MLMDSPNTWRNAGIAYTCPFDFFHGGKIQFKKWKPASPQPRSSKVDGCCLLPPQWSAPDRGPSQRGKAQLNQEWPLKL